MKPYLALFVSALSAELGEHFPAQPHTRLRFPRPFHPKILKDCNIPQVCVSFRYPSIHDS
jgi:hypothetical protein